MRTVDPEKHAARRTAILEAAAVVFASRGFDGTTTAAVCEAAGIGSGTLFHYFPDKRAIFHALFADDLATTESLLADLDRSDPVAALDALITHRTRDAGDPLVPGLVLAALTQVGRDPEFAVLMGQDDERVRATVTELLAAAAAAGRIDAGLDPRRAATWVCSLVDALYLQAGDDDFDADAQVAMLHTIVRRFLRVAET